MARVVRPQEVTPAASAGSTAARPDEFVTPHAWPASHAIKEGRRDVHGSGSPSPRYRRRRRNSIGLWSPSGKSFHAGAPPLAVTRPTPAPAWPHA